MLVENIKNQAIWKSVSLAEKACWIPEKQSDPTISFLIKGNIQLTVNDTDVYTVDRHEMFLFPDVTHCKIEALEQSHLVVCSLSVEFLLSDKKLLEELAFGDAGQPEFLKKLPVSKTILQFLLLLHKCMEEGLDSYYFFDLKRSELNLLLYAYYEKRELAHFFRDVLSKDTRFRQFVLNNWLTVKNVQELAALANYSTSGFIKKFQKIFGESPYKWMQQQKATRILIELNRGIKSLQEIANEYKFSSYQHFAGFCKVTFGFPPTEIYRKSLEIKT